MADLVGSYLAFLGFDHVPDPSLDTLKALHRAHIYTVPFENYSMGARMKPPATLPELHHAVTVENRGGICFETARLMGAAMTTIGFDHRPVLASVAGAAATPATHQLFLVNLGDSEWIFDIGYGAQGPRGVLPLRDGAVSAHGVLSTSVTLSPQGAADTWTVSVMEHAVGEQTWRAIYSFTPDSATHATIDTAHRYTAHAPTSLLRIHKVISLPTPRGRISIRDWHYTEIDHEKKGSRRLMSPRELRTVLRERFHIDVAADELPTWQHERRS